jgi:hypothetical protein
MVFHSLKTRMRLCAVLPAECGKTKLPLLAQRYHQKMRRASAGDLRRTDFCRGRKRFPFERNRSNDKKSLKIKMLEQALIEKVYQLFRSLLQITLRSAFRRNRLNAENVIDSKELKRALREAMGGGRGWDFLLSGRLVAIAPLSRRERRAAAGLSCLRRKTRRSSPSSRARLGPTQLLKRIAQLEDV